MGPSGPVSIYRRTHMIDILFNIALVIGGIAIQTFYPAVGNAVMEQVKKFIDMIKGTK
jgi:hypothetical protein